MAQRKKDKKGKKADSATKYPVNKTQSDKQFILTSDWMNVILDNLPSPVVVLSGDLSVVFASNAAMPFVSAAEKTLSPVISGVAEIVRDFIAKDMQTEIIDEVTIKVDRELRYVKIKMFKISGDILLCFEDISQEVSLRSQLRQAQKMESIGQLTTGIAHDFNNILTVIGGYSDIIRKKLSDEPLKKYLDQIYISAAKGTAFIRGLLAFSRKNDAEYAPCDLNQLIDSVVSMFDRILEDNIKLTVIPYEQELCVTANIVQLELVILNLLINAQDAMPDGGSIVIALNTANAEDINIPPPSVSTFAVIKVTDNGHGMDSLVLEQIFKPFFTTKPPNKGTGLGLAMVQDIVKSHKGTIICNSVVNEGTIFNIYLPIMSAGNDKLY